MSIPRDIVYLGPKKNETRKINIGESKMILNINIYNIKIKRFTLKNSSFIILSKNADIASVPVA